MFLVGITLPETSLMLRTEDSSLQKLPPRYMAECHSVVVQQRSFVKGNYDGSVGNKQPRLVGTAIDYTIPKHLGFGWINIDGTPRVQIRMHYKADGGWDFYPNRFRGGSLFGFADGAESTAVLNEGGGIFGQEYYHLQGST